jgi:RNA polymerase sigma-70 factor (ECF subfamily)
MSASGFNAGLCRSAVPNDNSAPSEHTELPWQEVKELYCQTHKALYVYLFYLLQSRPDAEDVLHETFVQAAKKWHTREKENATKAWLYKIAANQAYNKHRERRNRREVALAEQAEHLAVRELISDHLPQEQVADLQLALDALRGLSAKQRKAYLLKHYFGLDTDDIASLLDCKPSTVRNHLYRAQETIDRQLGGSSAKRTNRDRSGVERR